MEAEAASSWPFLEGGGEMGARMRAHDWSTSPLGSPSTWPQSLRSMISALLNSPMLGALLWGPNLIFLYNDAYIPSLADRHHTALGRPVAEVWGSAWEQVSPLFLRALATGDGFVQQTVEIPMARRGKAELTYWDFTATPVRGETGGIVGLLNQGVETTAQVLTMRALRESTERLAAMVNATANVLYRMSPDWAELRYLDGRGFISDTHAPSRTWLNDYIHSDDHMQIQEEIQAAIRTKSTFELEHRVWRTDGSLGWALSRAVPLLDTEGEIKEWVGAAVDVTERRRAEERQQLLMREVDHRAKNALAVVQATLSLTRAPDTASYVRVVTGRVAALARAQTLLADDRWHGADLRSLLEGELAPFLGSDQRAVLDGPPVALPAHAAQPLGMAVHELATNAVKYGGLSVPTGRVTLTWYLDGGSDGLLQLRWAEEGGPPVKGSPTRRGFGSRVVEGTVRGQLAGAVAFTWEPIGLACDIQVPLRRDPPFPVLEGDTGFSAD